MTMTIFSERFETEQALRMSVEADINGGEPGGLPSMGLHRVGHD